MIVDGSPTQAGGDGPLLPHRRRDPAPQPGGTFDSADQVSPPAATEISDLHDQEH